jgi:bifunctional UDP-N-acetylglucosamine pyrophosphorylase/glucosamine-1-phosphate N-acetyltransferase
MSAELADRNFLAIVLAAGEGTRMRSRRAKVLHEIGGRPLLAHVLEAVSNAGASRTAVVIGPGQEAVQAEVKRRAPRAQIYVQAERRGTAHALLCAREAFAPQADDVVVLFGDTPLVRAETVLRLRAALAAGAAVAVLGFRPKDPTGYGRLIMDKGKLLAIREHNDASEVERRIRLCNGGLMALRGESALAVLDKIGDANAKREFYLTDAVAVAVSMGLSATAIETEEDEVRGVNNREQLAHAEAALQWRLRDAVMEDGVTLIAPETVFLSQDTRLGRDVVVEPHVVFGPGVVVEDDAVIRSFSHVEGAHVGKGAVVGPYARLRPGTKLGEKVRVGNFVEIKAASIEQGAKVNHLSYIGDTRVGEGANIGAGTITCNYDGTAKHRTDIGSGAFIGSNTALVAPVSIGEGAYIGSGSVITRSVPADALAVGRGRQVVKEGWAGAKRKELASLKAEKPSDA